MKTLLNNFKQKYKTFFSCHTCDDDDNRRVFILSVILSGSVILTVGAFLLAIADMIGRGSNYRGIDLLPLFIPLIFFGVLILLVRTRYHNLAAYLLLLFYFLCASYSIYSWGFVLPTGLLIFALIVIMAGIVINTSTAIIVSFISIGTIVAIAEFQAIGLIEPDLYWINDLIGVDDALVYVFILAVITAVAWLSNREIDKSLRRARESELALKHERDQLEVKVQQRTKELQQAQLAQMAQLYRFAELGQLSAGILHDIANPLTTVSLNLEQLEIERRSQLVKRARQGIKQMQDFIVTARHQLQSEKSQKEFSVTQEIKTALTMLNYRLRKEHLRAKLKETHKVILMGNEVKFQQLIMNLVNNAIDSYTESVADDRLILLTVSQRNKKGHITIKDSGRGMTDKEIDTAFDAFFTTKSKEGGMGLGLAICRDIMHKEFHGTIKLTSKVGHGTTVTLQFPLA